VESIEEAAVWKAEESDPSLRSNRTSRIKRRMMKVKEKKMGEI
jgi:hypothetical protein